MQFKRFASAVALAGMLAVGSAAGAHAVNYPPTQVLPKQPTVPPKVVTPEANRPGVKNAAPAPQAPAGDTGDQLAYTGSDALIGAAAGALLILGGAGAVAASRRRSTN